MEWQQLIIDIYMRVSRELERVLDGLTVEDLNQRPHPDCTSIGWLAWHVVRGQDRTIADFTQEKQLWIKEGWHTIFKRIANLQDTGFGHTSEDVASFKSPDSKTILAYHHAVLEQLIRYLTKLSEDELGREFESSIDSSTITVHARLVSNINDNLQHVGQAAYVRGLLKGRGWLGK